MRHSTTSPTVDDLVIVLSGGTGLDPSAQTVAAASRARSLGVIDLDRGDAWSLRTVEQCARRAVERLGVRVSADCRASLADVEKASGGRVDTVVLTADAPWAVVDLIDRCRVMVEVTDVTEAHTAARAGAHGLIARGTESGGRVSALSSFVLLQQLAGDHALTLPIWVAGGIGPRTAAACVVGGATGVVLDSQLLLLPEAALSDRVRAAVRRMDGSETVLVGNRRGLPLGGRRDDPTELVAVGQDGWLATAFLDRWPGTAAAVRGVREAILDALRPEATDEARRTLEPGSPLAETLGVSLPVAQGPMTRVSNEAGFAAAVAAEGGLPFIALALANAEESRRLLTEAAAALGDRPWGVGVLGFAPEEVRTAQIEVIREIRPACAIIAGGRPAQAKGLEADGVRSFLHVPSPGLLKQFLQAGARRFVFEGAECGGHIGPQTSFGLWEAQVRVLEEFLDGQPADDSADLQVLFAGGIHDERSAAMVAALCVPLTRRGVQAGVLMGSAYLFTSEAVTHGAIQPGFQQQAVEATSTALLETAPGHVTRCLQSAFVEEFRTRRRELDAAGVENRQAWEQLEMLNVGRLRIASKGLRREGDELVAVDAETQASEGMFMAGQVAVLRDTVTTVARLHDQVSTGAARYGEDRMATVRSALALEDEVSVEAPPPLDIAVIGMACVFPGSPDLDGFWHTVLSGTDAVTEVPGERWDTSVYYAPEVGPKQTGRVSVSKWGGFLDPVPFDALRYGIPPSALASIDPTQLLALEISYRALVDAGYPASGGDGRGIDHSRTGVVFGAEEGSDLSRAMNLRTTLPAYAGDVPPPLDDVLPRLTEDTFPGVLANVIAGRITNRLDLGGPNFTIDAACASSLAALDVACKHLTAGTSDLMLCGAADLHNGITDYLLFTSAQALSKTGRCRTFDSAGDGIALGEGVACVVLKRLADAERNGDRVYAVVKGVGGSSDGRALGLTAPRPQGQRRALDRAYAEAHVCPADVGLVEAHGTGTVVGDRTELETLTRLFVESGARAGGTAIGSVKSQIGHTKCAAGMAGLIKTALSLYTGVKPPTLHLQRPNPAWDPESSPFVFHTDASPWAAPAEDRVAGVSAFGFGGTNFHAVLQAHPPSADPQHAQHQWPAELFCFRGTDRETARGAVRRLLAEAEAAGPDVPLRALAAVAARDSDARTGAVRIAVVAKDHADLVDLLTRAVAGEHEPRRGLIAPPEAPADGPGKVAFLFPGQGSQRPGALADLFVAFPELRHYVDLGREWADLLFPPSAFDDDTAQEQADRVRDTRVAQPVLGIGGLAVDHLLRRLGVRPDMAGGHSYGELVALCTAGAFDAATLLDLSRQRGLAILGATGDDSGTMAAVTGGAAEIEAVLSAAGLSGEVVLANHNAPSQVAISGPTAAIERAIAALQEADLRARRLPVAAAFHSPVVAAGAETFAAVLADRPIAAPLLPVWSNSATVYAADAEAVRAGLASQIGAPVRFVDQIEAMYADGARVFVEAGPGSVLSGLVPAVLGDRPHLMITCDGRPGQGLRALLTAAAELACAGVDIQTGFLFSGRTETVPPPREADRRVWTVNGQLVRDHQGNCLSGGMSPPHQIEELLMRPTTSGDPAGNGHSVHPSSGGTQELLTDFLRTSRDMIAAQRDVLLAYLAGGGDGRLVWSPAPPPEVVAAAVEADAVPAVPELTVEPDGLSGAAPPAAPDVQAAVLGVISERTGYPVELIELHLDLEADLSVDSIKRAEVAGEVVSRLGLSGLGAEVELDELVKARTVLAMVSWLEARLAPAADSAAPTSDSGLGVAPRRLITRLEPAPLATDPSPVGGVPFHIIGDTPVGPVLSQLLVESGASPTADVKPGGPTPGEIVLLLDGLREGAPLLPDLYATVRDTLAAGPRWLLAAGRVGGGPRTDGMAGLFRTLALEHPELNVRYVEVPAEADDTEAAHWLLDELSDPTPAAVVTRQADGRYAPRPTPADLGAVASRGAGPAADGVAEASALGLDSDSVVVCVGGARGITPWFAHLLARNVRCRIALVGRTALPQTDPDPELASADTAAALRSAFAARGLRNPAEIDRAARSVLAVREVTTTIAELTELGAEVSYSSLDVNDADATHRLIKQLRDEHGRIDGLVYAAGVIEDRLVADKDPASFERVYRTKVDGARFVLEALDQCGAEPAFVALFGSVAAVYGNRGQSDYAAANDALEALATRWAQENGRRTLTVHWGPWAPLGAHAGMVTPELVADYASRGIELVNPEEGALSLLRELAWGDAASPSVVYTASGW